MTALPRPKFLNIRDGQKWLTAKGREIEILSLDLTCKTDFPISAIYSDDSRTKVSWTGATTDGDMLASRIQVEAAVPVVDLYLEAAIGDELKLAGLLGWQNFCRPVAITPSCSIQGTHSARHGHKLHSSVSMPQWRRSWHAAGQLVSRCKLTIAPTDGGVAVHAETGPSFRAIYSEHPSEDHAIWFAMCKAAIAYLEAK